jgi:hypothetical protein
MTTAESHINEEDLRTRFNVPAEFVTPKGFSEYMKGVDTRHHTPTASELEEYLSLLFKKMTFKGARRTPKENLEAFEKGWRENLAALQNGGPTADALRPRYFRGSKFLRYRGGLIVTADEQLEYHLLVLARYLFLSLYLSDVEHIYELGCGSCSNLLLLSQMFPNKQLHGWDWTQASVDITTELRVRHGIRCDGQRFDMLNPPARLGLAPDSAVLTIHAMEQLGSDHATLIDRIIEAHPAIVVQLEPIVELYDRENVYDQLALFYSRERNYLSGYLPALRRLEADRKIELIAVHRPYVGGVLHESSLIVWRPTRQ